MNGYVQSILDSYHHAPPNKPQLYTHPKTEISYTSTVQYPSETYSRPPLNALGIKQVQVIIGSLLYYARDIENKLIVSLCAIRSQKASSTKRILYEITQLIDHITLYPNCGITYYTSSMFHTGHSDDSFIN